MHAKVASKTVQVIEAPHAVLSAPVTAAIRDSGPRDNTIFILTIVAVAVLSIAVGMCCVILLLRRRIKNAIQRRAAERVQIPASTVAATSFASSTYRHNDRPQPSAVDWQQQQPPRSPPSSHPASHSDAQRMGILQSQQQPNFYAGSRPQQPRQQGMMVLGPPC
jgi:hypothetical protein